MPGTRGAPEGQAKDRLIDPLDPEDDLAFPLACGCEADPWKWIQLGEWVWLYRCRCGLVYWITESGKC